MSLQSADSAPAQRRRSAPRPALVAAFLVGAMLNALAQDAAAAEARAMSGVCVRQLADAAGLGGGIATGRLVTALEAVLCDGRHMRIAMRDGALVLSSAAAPAQPAQDPDRLPDGQTTVGNGPVARAWLAGPTADYGHAILGDALEASAVRVQTNDSTVASFALPPGSVFEDLRARLVDLTGDGADEIIVVRSYLDRGAALAVYELTDGRLSLLAESPPIGRPHRWLNPAGAADFDGDGRVEIAHVETPHIGGILHLSELIDGRLVREQSVAGFSNHRIGSRVLDLAAVADWNGDGTPDLALPDARRRTLRVVTFTGGTFAQLAGVPHDAEITTALVATDLDADGRPELLYGLEDGTLMMTTP